MSEHNKFKPVLFEPVAGIVIEKSGPIPLKDANLSFKGISTKNSEQIGYIEGFVEDGLYSDIDTINVYPQWRGQNFGSALFMHFIKNVIEERHVRTISIAASNERSAHLMEKIPGVKEFSFFKDGKSLPGFTIAKVVKELESAREKEKNEDVNIGITDALMKTSFRITAQL